MCNNTCRLCRRLILSQAVTFAGDTLTINIPDARYCGCYKYCFVIAQAIPEETTIGAEVVITIGDDATEYPLVDCIGEPVTAGDISTRTRYAVNITETNFRLTNRIVRGD